MPRTTRLPLRIGPLVVPLVIAGGIAAAPPLSDARDGSGSPAPRIVTTLQMDPEKPQEITGWWVAGRQLLHVDPDGRFRRWENHDRLARPSEVGRWHRENHAVFWLEAYTVPKSPRRRVALWLQDGGLMANLSGSSTSMRHSETPPRIPADDLLGVWTGSGGRLEFRPDSTYAWIAPPGDEVEAARISGQRGRWHLDARRRLRLEPLVISQEPAVLELLVDDGPTPAPEDDRVVGIRSIAGLLERPTPSPAEPDATGVNPVGEPSEAGSDDAD